MNSARSRHPRTRTSIARAWAAAVLVVAWQSAGAGRAGAQGLSCLALSAALAIPGARAVVFDPAGISPRDWDAAGAANQRRMAERSTAFIALTASAMDPVAAASVSGMSIIPAHTYVVPVDYGGSPLERHAIATM